MGNSIFYDFLSMDGYKVEKHSICIIDDSLILYYNIVKSYYLIFRFYGQPI